MTKQRVPDEMLAARAREGDEAAWQTLLERRMPVLRARLRKRLPAMLRRKVSESDVIQEAHLAAYQRLPDFEDRGEGSFGRWLDQIVEFKLRKTLRRFRGTAKRGVDREVTRGQRPDTLQFRGREPSPSAHAIAGELTERVAAAMADLSDDHRLVIQLVKEQGLSFAEAAGRLDRSENAVIKLYTRALCRLTEIVTR